MELIKIETNENGTNLVKSIKDIYIGAEMDKSHWSRWYSKNIEDNIFFKENIDYHRFATMANGNKSTDFSCTLEMAEHLVMQMPTEKAHMYRQYLIDVKTAWNTPEMIMARALQLANHKIEQFSNEVKKLKTEVIHKEGVIIGLVSDISLAEKRQRITQIVRYGANNNYQERYRLLHSEVQKKFHLDLNRRIESKEVLEIKPKIKNKMDLLERGIFINGSVRNLIPETYEIACKLFENDLKELLKEWDSTIQRI